MYRLAKQSPFLRMREQSCCERPALTLQTPVSHINIELPDRIRFRYPDADGRDMTQDVEVRVLGENAHGVCFLTGVSASASAAKPQEPGNAMAFRIDTIAGPITRVSTAEVLPVHAWERRVRRRFAMDRDTDALPLSSMLIAARQNSPDTPE
ncbi:MAG: hypothetical protein JWP38_815 [Herbaspirillum sp.]|jgi:hypothetical protein|nr:hypothetical protein [Herbaspirillum sp.]